MNSSFTASLAGFLAMATALGAAAGNWPAWRGPEGTGVAPDKNLPTRWSTNENVRWRVDLPGRGNSSPIVWGDRVFVAQAVSAENRRTLICFDRKTGKKLWQEGVTYADKEPTQRENPYCAATPVTDGERVIASFGSAGLYCYDLAGKELWHRDLGKMNHMFGNASSPVLHGDFCFLNFGPDEKARLIAVNKRTGATAWEAEPPKVDPSEQPQRGGGPGGFGGGGGGGIGMTLGPLLFTQADKNDDKKVTRDEFTALAEQWFDKLDPDKTGKLTAEQFGNKFYDALPRAQGGPNDNPGGDGGPRRGPSRNTAPAVFAAVDTDKDGSLTRAELKNTFGKWFGQWDSTQAGSVNEDQLQKGLTAAIPRTNFGGGPGGQGGPGRQGGPGGRGGPGGGGGAGGPGGSWSTPIVVKAGDHAELVMNFPNRLAAYDPATGKQLWLSKGLGGTIYSTPIWGEGALIAVSSGMGGGNAIAIKPGGSGDVTESQRVWRLDRVKGGIGSGVIHNGYIFLISQDGIAVCLDAKSGKTVWEERLRGSGSRNGSWSSMLLAGDNIYVPNQSGDVFVLRAGPKFELLATNSVRESTNASLAASDGDLFLRTDAGLWCLAEAK